MKRFPSPHRALWALLAVAAIVRIGIFVTRPDALATDPDNYRTLAENLVEYGVFGQGTVPTAYRPPAYPLLLVPCMAIGIGSGTAIGVLHVGLGLATVGLTFALARRAGLHDGPAALAAGLVVLDPILLSQSTVVMSETLAALLTVLGIWLLDRCTRSPTLGNAVLAGAALGALVLCRPGLLAFAFLAVMLLPWLTLRTERTEHGFEKGAMGRRKAWRSFAGILAGLAVVVGPWVVRNQMVFGRPTAATTHGGYTLLLGNNRSFYNHLRQGRWFRAWHAEPFHAWWRRELLANDWIEPSVSDQVSQPATRRSAGIPLDHEKPTDRFPLASAADACKDVPLLFRFPGAELQADALAYRHAFASIRRHPGMFAWSCLVRAGRFWSPLPFRLSSDENARRRIARWGVAVWYVAQFGLAAAGLYYMLFKSCTGRSVALWSLLVALTLTSVHTVYWSNLRMRAPLTPLVALAAAAGIVAIRRKA